METNRFFVGPAPVYERLVRAINGSTASETEKLFLRTLAAELNEVSSKLTLKLEEEQRVFGLLADRYLSAQRALSAVPRN